MSRRLLVLGWHNVHGTWCFPSPPGRGALGLQRQLAALARWASVVPLRESLETLLGGGYLPPRAVAVTFDDGYADNLAVAVPALERRGLPATFFLVPDLLSGTVEAWWEVLGWAFMCTTRDDLRWDAGRLRLHPTARRRMAYVSVAEALKRRSQVLRHQAVEEIVGQLAPAGPRPGRAMFLDWPGARQLVARGFAVGSHSSAHAILSEEDPDTQDADLVRSRAELERELEVAIDMVAYPNGTRRDYDGHTLAAATRAGYAYGITTVEGLNRPDTPRLEVRRSVVYPERGPRDVVASLRHAVPTGSRSAGRSG